ncbi:MAG: hypothetical protein QOG53_2182 [Frankiales bacterium]|jgi:hypothetical protein|nr:hypothetical protein [Frankiales bacterium]
MRRGLLLIALVVSLAGCSSGGTSNAPSATPTPGDGSKTVHLTKVDFGDAWPLLVPEADVQCKPAAGGAPTEVFMVLDGRTYGLNVPALGRLPEVPDRLLKKGRDGRDDLGAFILPGVAPCEG